ncbi:PTS-dependent dihydroxyacetone kinase phosphotransferase subunit DhaM [Mycoplasma sp. NEAQ87857]|uniref:PTS-dependent dihydroxyacetone kinase phosphotransferase subunit DhaM n=1 Tax=Mycoplasma sp. NEAQ87857 TaxID=2683967 RepID=UPI00131C9713|nr:dihydroxyacetone kinase [Mycoplasma sp. NEAQ87857]
MIVSHSYHLAKGLAKLLEDVKTTNVFIIDYSGGLDVETIGTDYVDINTKVNNLLTANNNDLIIICDLGSSIMTSEMVIDGLDLNNQQRVMIAKTPFVEGGFVAVGLSSVCDTVADLYMKMVEQLPIIK